MDSYPSKTPSHRAPTLTASMNLNLTVATEGSGVYATM